jgi:hypothetical protein
MHTVVLVPLLVALLAGPYGADAQLPPKVHRVGFLGGASAVGYVRMVEALQHGLRDLGYVEGKNLVVEYRWADGRYDRLAELAGELVRLNVSSSRTMECSSRTWTGSRRWRRDDVWQASGSRNTPRRAV